MKIVLRADVDNVGKKGDIVDVADGFARNFLVPKGLRHQGHATGVEAQAASMRRSRDLKDAKDREAAEDVARTLVPAVITRPGQGRRRGQAVRLGHHRRRGRRGAGADRRRARPPQAAPRRADQDRSAPTGAGEAAQRRRVPRHRRGRRRADDSGPAPGGDVGPSHAPWSMLDDAVIVAQRLSTRAHETLWWSPSDPTGCRGKVDGRMVQPIEPHGPAHADAPAPRPAGSRRTTSRPRSRCSAPCCCRRTPSPRPSRSCGADDFYKPAHGHIFDAITSLYGRGRAGRPGHRRRRAAPGRPARRHRRPGRAASAAGHTPATSNAGRYATIVEEHALLRRLIGVAGEIAEMGYDAARRRRPRPSTAPSRWSSRSPSAASPTRIDADPRPARRQPRPPRGSSTSGARPSPACPPASPTSTSCSSGLQPSAPDRRRRPARPWARPRSRWAWPPTPPSRRSGRCCSSRWR